MSVIEQVPPRDAKPFPVFLEELRRKIDPRYSVLLLFPPGYTSGVKVVESFYAFVEAANELEAVSEAKRQACATGPPCDPEQLKQLLVIPGWHPNLLPVRHPLVLDFMNEIAFRFRHLGGEPLETRDAVD